MTAARAFFSRFDGALLFNSAYIALALALAAITGAQMGFRLQLGEPHLILGGLAALILLAIVWFVYTYLRPDDILAGLCLYTALFIIGSVALGPLSYMAAALNFPLQDKSLAAIDLALGLNWLDWLAFSIENDWLREWSNFFYQLTIPMIMVSMLVLPFAYGVTSLKRFVTTYSLCGFIVCILSAPFAAEGTYPYYGIDLQSLNGFAPAIFEVGAFVDYIPTFNGLRDGTIRTISITDSKGIVAFPSFHAVLSVLMILCYAGRSPLQGVLFGIAVVINVAILITVPVSGGHYFIDVIAGILVGAFGWVVSGYIVGKDRDWQPTPDRLLPADASRQAAPQP